MSEKPEAFIYADMLEVSVEEYSAQGVDWREASRLGDLLEELAKLCNAPSHGWQLNAAAELRRQHAKIERLTADNERLRDEVRVLRLYGNKDCTAMADEAMKKAALRRED